MLKLTSKNDEMHITQGFARAVFVYADVDAGQQDGVVWPAVVGEIQVGLPATEARQGLISFVLQLETLHNNYNNF